MRLPALLAVIAAAAAPSALAGFSNNILLTGYWPPTNEMLRPWSSNSEQNPDGWIGENWEGRGYNIHSFFPEFPNGFGQGVGDFEVDYQDTSADWWRITEELRPVAIITFSRGAANLSWEIESRNRKLPLSQWSPDYTAPFRPTEDLPIADEPDNLIRHSSLPMNNIRSAINAAGLGIFSIIDTSNNFGGNFLSEFIGYHGNWYHDLHADETDPWWNVAAGHIHVGIPVSVAQGRAATEITLRELIAHVDSIVPEPATLLGLTMLAALRRRRP